MENNETIKRISPNTESKLGTIVRTIINAVNPNRLYLFGSRVNGSKDDESDYDFLIIYDGPFTKREIELKVIKSFSKFDFSMDLFILSSSDFDRQKHLPMTLAREVYETGCLVDA